MRAVELDGGDVVDSVLALFDNALDFGEPEVPTIIFLPRRACHEAKVGDREDYSVENGLVPFVEGAVYKNLIAGVSYAGAAGLLLVGHG